MSLNTFLEFCTLAFKHNAKTTKRTEAEYIAVFYPPFSNAQNLMIELEELLYNATDEGETLANLVYDGAIIDMVFDEMHEFCEIVFIP